MALFKTGTWVLVADGEKALFLENTGDVRAPALEVRRMKEQDNPPTREQATAAPGRVQSSATTSSPAYDETDWHRLEKERFAQHLADTMLDMARADRFRQIVVVAPPLVLGELRSAWDSEVGARVVAEIDKTLTNHTVTDITEIVVQELDAL
ncbi:MAG: host attachment family protein [Alphaproteobacteria bacterium]|nr:host attachment family protein [Alphaproteobacteria bacterium]